MRRALPISESTCRRSSILPTAPSTASCEHFTQGSCLDREKRRKLVFHLFITWHSDPLRLRRHDGRSCWCRRPTGGMNYKLWICKHCFRENNWRTQWKSGIKTCCDFGNFRTHFQNFGMILEISGSFSGSCKFRWHLSHFTKLFLFLSKVSRNLAGVARNPRYLP